MVAVKLDFVYFGLAFAVRRCQGFRCDGGLAGLFLARCSAVKPGVATRGLGFLHRDAFPSQSNATWKARKLIWTCSSPSIAQLGAGAKLQVLDVGKGGGANDR